MSDGPSKGRGPALVVCLLGGLIAFVLALVGLLPESDFSVKEPLDLIKLTHDIELELLDVCDRSMENP